MDNVEYLLNEIEKTWKKVQGELDTLLKEVNHKKMIISSLKSSYDGIKDTLETGRLSLNSPITEINPIQNKIELEFWTRYNSFDKDMSYPQKIRFMIHAENRFLHKKEMAKILYRLDKRLTISEYEKKIDGALHKVKTNEFDAICYKVNDNLANSFWGRKHYLNEDGTINEKHMYNKEYLFKRSKLFSIKE